ncbi:hypothetical protein DMUE_3256 [Dictyocoela muelleri]|nr:hypothetical protein DMUE_3256 [Dictyocoela muelleri]
MKQDYLYFISQRGSVILVHNEYLYKKDTLIQGLQRWRCRKRSFRVSVTQNTETGAIQRVKEHNHAQEKEELLRVSVDSITKEKALETNNAPSDIILNTIKNCSDEDLANLQIIESLRDKITKLITRQMRGDNFTILDDIPFALKKTLDEDDFLMFDSGINESERVLIFSENKT